MSRKRVNCYLIEVCNIKVVKIEGDLGDIKEGETNLQVKSRVFDMYRNFIKIKFEPSL